MKSRDILKFVLNAKALALLMMNNSKDINTVNDLSTLIDELDRAIVELRGRH